MLATRDAYDIAIVFSGDLDIAPAITAVHSLGKQAWVATFGDDNLSRTLSRSAWGLINLLDHLSSFSFNDLGTSPITRVPQDPDQMDEEMHRELRRAQAHFEAGGGFVGAHYFVHRWKGHHIPDIPEERRQSVQRLMDIGRAETYEVDGKTAVRALFPDAEESPSVAEDETASPAEPEGVRTVLRRKADESTT
jgi:hypothetical protein